MIYVKVGAFVETMMERSRSRRREVIVDISEPELFTSATLPLSSRFLRLGLHCLQSLFTGKWRHLVSRSCFNLGNFDDQLLYKKKRAYDSGSEKTRKTVSEQALPVAG